MNLLQGAYFVFWTLLVLTIFLLILVSNRSVLLEVWREIERYERMKLVGYMVKEKNCDRKKNEENDIFVYIMISGLVGFLLGYYLK
jgi:hypothetical protein